MSKKKQEPKTGKLKQAKLPHADLVKRGVLEELADVDRALLAKEEEKAEENKKFNTDLKQLKKDRRALLEEIDQQGYGQMVLE